MLPVEQLAQRLGCGRRVQPVERTGGEREAGVVVARRPLVVAAASTRRSPARELVGQRRSRAPAAAPCRARARRRRPSRCRSTSANSLSRPWRSTSDHQRLRRVGDAEVVGHDVDHLTEAGTAQRGDEARRARSPPSSSSTRSGRRRRSRGWSRRRPAGTATGSVATRRARRGSRRRRGGVVEAELGPRAAAGRWRPATRAQVDGASSGRRRRAQRTNTTLDRPISTSIVEPAHGARRLDRSTPRPVAVSIAELPLSAPAFRRAP